MKETWLLTDGCKARQSTIANKALIRDAVNLNVAELCVRCSGAVACGERLQIFHPSAHLSAAQIVQRV